MSSTMLVRKTFLRGRYLNYARGFYATIITNLIGVIILVEMHQEMHIVPGITARVFSACMMSLALMFCLAIIGPNLPEAFNASDKRDEEEQKTHDTAANLVGYGATLGILALMGLCITIVMLIIF